MNIANDVNECCRTTIQFVTDHFRHKCCLTTSDDYDCMCLKCGKRYVREYYESVPLGVFICENLKEDKASEERITETSQQIMAELLCQSEDNIECIDSYRKLQDNFNQLSLDDRKNIEQSIVRVINEFLKDVDKEG